ncbi:MAG: L,D-transpeptidase [Gloeobacteraceae cyanobacterium ES-bin-144]|nr:L,D-transpeptidase [Verrucomicrobiales bacterium]
MTGCKSTLLLNAFLGLFAAVAFSSCTNTPFGRDTHNKMIVSVSDQKMLLVRDGKPIKTYKISTSKFGVGDRPGSNCTPLGRLQIAKKIGSNAVIGSVFKHRRPTGEVLKPNAPGRDPVVTRILWLTGTEVRNRNTYKRTIYIHGTPEERRLGSPASYGCIRMGSRDVADLFKRVGYGADVFVIRGSIQSTQSSSQSSARNKSENSDTDHSG